MANRSTQRQYLYSSERDYLLKVLFWICRKLWNLWICTVHVWPWCLMVWSKTFPHLLIFLSVKWVFKSRKYINLLESINHPMIKGQSVIDNLLPFHSEIKRGVECLDVETPCTCRLMSCVFYSGLLLHNMSVLSRAGPALTSFSCKIFWGIFWEMQCVFKTWNLLRKRSLCSENVP